MEITTLLLLLCLAGARPTAAETHRRLRVEESVSFNEILADAPGPEGDGGGEWIELLNHGHGAVDLDGWVVGDETDTHDRLLPWTPGGPTMLSGGGFALLLDPDGDPAAWNLPDGVLLLRTEDSSLGNGLRSGGERIHLLDPAGAMIDTARWSSGAGDGISWERAPGGMDGGGGWRPCRAKSGSTPGRMNSWTPQPGDRSVSWIDPPERPLLPAVDNRLAAAVRDEGGMGLRGMVLGVLATHENGIVDDLPAGLVPAVSPGDSAEVEWWWRPPRSGRWEMRVYVEEPRTWRNWQDDDTMTVGVCHPPRSRVLTEAQPRPVEGGVEWLEFCIQEVEGGSRDAQGEAWDGWSIRTRSLASPYSSGRNYPISGYEGPVLLLAAGDSVRIPSGAWWSGRAVPPLIWSGLRLTDTGSAITLSDPTGTVVDSSVLRPVPGLPRGHAWQRWNPRLPGWSPDAWGLSRSADDVTPGWVEVLGADSEQGMEGGGLELRIEHLPGGRVIISWSAPEPAIWMEIELRDMSGRFVSTVLPRVLVPGVDSEEWDPGGRERVRPGIYVLVCRAEASGSPARWVLRRALGVRP